MNRKEDLGEELYEVVVTGLIKRLKSNECTYQDYKNAIDFLKNNGITAEPRKGTPLEILKDNVLPFTMKAVENE